MLIREVPRGQVPYNSCESLGKRLQVKRRIHRTACRLAPQSIPSLGTSPSATRPSCSFKIRSRGSPLRGAPPQSKRVREQREVQQRGLLGKWNQPEVIVGFCSCDCPLRHWMNINLEGNNNSDEDSMLHGSSWLNYSGLSDGVRGIQSSSILDGGSRLDNVGDNLRVVEALLERERGRGNRLRKLQEVFEVKKFGYTKMPTIFENVYCMFRRCLFSVLSAGPIPNHIAIIMDGNRRYAKKQRVQQGTGHRAGFSALISILRHCYEMGVKYVTIYAFSIDNFKRNPEEVQSIMDLLKEKLDEMLQEQSIVSEYGIKINFWGDLNLLNDEVRMSVDKAMRNTSHNSGPVLSVCVAYTSSNEIVHAIGKTCYEKIEMNRKVNSNEYGNGFAQDNMKNFITVADLELHLNSAECPEPDIVIRTSGETRLSNFLLWQSGFSHLQNPASLWPEFSLRHLVWAILKYQRAYSYLHSRRKQMYIGGKSY